MTYDVVIIGSGVGGSGVARQLAGSDLKVLILERGPHLPREAQNWDPEAVFCQQRYRTTETWWADNEPFSPGMFYYVGGSTKFFGTAMFRFRERDFEAMTHQEGQSPAWPISYRDLAPWYDLAENYFGVHGASVLDKDGIFSTGDPTEPPRHMAYPYPAIPHEPLIGHIATKLQAQGLHPFPMPSAVNYFSAAKDSAGVADTTQCLRCPNCDAHPCQIDAKGDAEIKLLRPALQRDNVELRPNCYVQRLETDESGQKVTAAWVRDESGKELRIVANTFIVSAGAINSAALLLRSANSRHSRGLANGSDVVGRHYMTHNTSALMAIHPWQKNLTHFPKTLAVHDFYFGDGEPPGIPLGSLQLLGKIREPMLRGPLSNWPRWLRTFLADHSVDWYAQSEDLPHPESRVTLRADGAINLHWHRTNLRAHQRWVEKCKKILRGTGYPVVLAKGFGTNVVSHQCGTVRFGANSADSALDPWNKAWELDNLYVVDASFFPSSAAVNPALTLAAQALRVGAHLRDALS